MRQIALRSWLDIDSSTRIIVEPTDVPRDHHAPVECFFRSSRLWKDTPPSRGTERPILNFAHSPRKGRTLMPDLLDRRNSPRWVAVNNQATLEFQGSHGKQRAKATLINISRDGALLVTDEVLPLCGTLWFRMESPAKTDWIGVNPVRHDHSRELGIRFAKPCMDDLLLAAMLGIDLGSSLFEGERPLSFADSWSGA